MHDHIDGKTAEPTLRVRQLLAKMKLVTLLPGIVRASSAAVVPRSWTGNQLLLLMKQFGMKSLVYFGGSMVDRPLSSTAFKMPADTRSSRRANVNASSKRMQPLARSDPISAFVQRHGFQGTFRKHLPKERARERERAAD